MKLPKVYNPSEYEGDIYALWEKSEAFAPKGKGKPYSIVVPPPNANASLHIGFALTMSLQDIAIRYHRLLGDRTLFVPGADHAGFETQAVFEKHLAKAGKSRFDFTREELYSQIWDFVAQNRQGFEEQFRRLGGSVDWSHYTFTLDQKVVKRAYATFKKMWDEGLVYRGERLVNYCTFHGTAFADIEVAYKEEKGSLWYIKYPLTDGSGEIVVATTRPETMLGDTGIAVHPDDARFAKFIGKTAKLPLTNREIPIIADDFVEKGFGTGAVKLTPAHDLNDFEAGKRHDLPMVNVIEHDGTISREVSETYGGFTIAEARKRIVADLDKQKLLEKTESLTHNVGHCYKCDTVIQPLLREQWFVDMQPLAQRAIKELEADKITFYPEAKKDQLINYLKNLRDWNISRQIAWGIPIPAFQNVDEPEDWIYDERVDQETIEVDGKTYHRDPDVFDTWFSSSSWPYATLDYPSDDLKTFYPLSLMETGGEILYPWVSRMIMLGLYVTGDIPFKAVYIHGYVMAEDGSKMSKSIGNVINAPEVIDEFGADALRMGIVASRAPAVNRGYDRRKVEDARNFCNKLWNIARYIEDKLGDQPKRTEKPKPETHADHWMLHKLQQTTEGIAADLDNYRFAEAFDRLYHFVWDDFADWYIEASKAQANNNLLAYALEAILKIAHPFAPFVTETIWQTLAWDDSILAMSHWPEVAGADEAQARTFEEIKTIVGETRTILKTLGLRSASMYYTDVPFLSENAELIKRLARLDNVSEVRDGEGLYLTQTLYRCWLDIDRDTARAYVQQLQEIASREAAAIKQLEGRLANKSYTEHAPTHIVAETRQQLEDANTRLASTQTEIEKFKVL
ncbi:MAG TPA: valine--tRNA ligase [Candidatus Saccharimonadales bacterium]|nr:valine--tRNA ligase [Candidatus Saccharimonadales bacterium]